MPVNFTTVFDSINNAVIDENKPNVFGGSRHANGALKGLALTAGGSGICNLLHWVKDNTPYSIFPDIQFRAEGAFIGWEVYSNSTGELVYRHPRRPFNGNFSASDPAQAVHELGKVIVTQFADYARNNIKV